MTPQLHSILQEAIKAFESGNLNSAELLLKKLTSFDPKNLPALQILGLIKAVQEDYKESAIFLERAANLQPNDASIQFNLAKALMDSGNDEKAVTHHKKTVTLNPHNSQAWLNYGKSVFNLGRYDEALELYDQAIRHKPDYYDAWINKSLVLFVLKRYLEADENCNQALLLKPDSCEANNNKGIILHALNQFEEALKYYELSIELNSNYYEAHNNKGITLHALERYEEALKHYDCAIALKPDYYEAWTNRGLTFQELKSNDNALLNFNKALSLNPTSTKCLLNRGLFFHEIGSFEEALNDYDLAISLKPDYFEVWSNRGVTLQELKCYDDALSNYEQAIQLAPHYSDAWLNKASLLYELRKFNEALTSCEIAINKNPDNFKAHNNKGLILTALNRHEEALLSFNECLHLKPSFSLALSNRGFTLHGLNRNQEALIDFNLALSINPNDEQTLWNKGLALLVEGDLESGFSLYETRLRSKKISTHFRSYNAPIWTGNECLRNKTIFVYGEQGFGDCIQFSRYLKLISNLGAHIVFEVPHALVSLMNNLDGVSKVIAMGQEPPPFDFHVALMSLPAIFKTNINNIPSDPHYFNLKEYPNKLMEWQTRLESKIKPRIGLVWSGNLNHKNDKNRSLLLETVVPYLPSQFEYICLQKEIRHEDQLTLNLNPNILSFSEFLNDFLDTAALIQQLDLVISVDTSVAHLSAALGQQTWILIPFAPDWRWLLNRDDSPWYRSVRLYRQDSIGNWSAPLLKIKSDLEMLGC